MVQLRKADKGEAWTCSATEGFWRGAEPGHRAMPTDGDRPFADSGAAHAAAGAKNIAPRRSCDPHSWKTPPKVGARCQAFWFFFQPSGPSVAMPLLARFRRPAFCRGP